MTSLLTAQRCFEKACKLTSCLQVLNRQVNRRRDFCESQRHFVNCLIETVCRCNDWSLVLKPATANLFVNLVCCSRLNVCEGGPISQYVYLVARHAYLHPSQARYQHRDQSRTHCTASNLFRMPSNKNLKIIVSHQGSPILL